MSKAVVNGEFEKRDVAPQMKTNSAGKAAIKKKLKQVFLSYFRGIYGTGA